MKSGAPTKSPRESGPTLIRDFKNWWWLNLGSGFSISVHIRGPDGKIPLIPTMKGLFPLSAAVSLPVTPASAFCLGRNFQNRVELGPVGGSGSSENRGLYAYLGTKDLREAEASGP